MEDHERAVQALVAVETTGRLAVHAAAALERGDQAETHRLLEAVAATALQAADLAPDEVVQSRVRRDARGAVTPLVGAVG